MLAGISGGGDMLSLIYPLRRNTSGTIYFLSAFIITQASRMQSINFLALVFKHYGAIRIEKGFPRPHTSVVASEL